MLQKVAECCSERHWAAHPKARTWDPSTERGARAQCPAQSVRGSRTLSCSCRYTSIKLCCCEGIHCEFSAERCASLAVCLLQIHRDDSFRIVIPCLLRLLQQYLAREQGQEVIITTVREPSTVKEYAEWHMCCTRIAVSFSASCHHRTGSRVRAAAASLPSASCSAFGHTLARCRTLSHENGRSPCLRTSPRNCLNTNARILDVNASCCVLLNIGK